VNRRDTRRRLERTESAQAVERAMDEMATEMALLVDRPLGLPQGAFVSDQQAILNDCLLMDPTAGALKVFLPSLKREDIGKGLSAVIASTTVNELQIVPPPGVKIDGIAGVATVRGGWSVTRLVSIGERDWFIALGNPKVTIDDDGTDTTRAPFVGAHAGLYAFDNADATVIASSGKDNKVQYIELDVLEPSRDATPSLDGSDIAIEVAGTYLVTVSITCWSASANQEVGVGVWKNNGATELQNIHAHRSFQTANKTGSISMSGLVALAVDDTLELWVWNETAGNNVVLGDVTMSAVRIDV